jgi:acetoin utilization deacetylase AcuC-like enzyme
MRMTEAGYARLATFVGRWSDELCGGRIVAVLEGGYDPGALGRSVAATLAALDGDADLSGFDGASAAE